MRWTELKIGNYITKISKIDGTPLVSIPDGYVDKDGNELIEVVESKRKSIWKSKEGVMVENRYKLINGKPMGKFKLIKEVPIERVREVPKLEAFDLNVESIYFVDSPLLLEHLSRKDKALKFHYSNGGGYKVYIAYITTFGNELVMYLGLDTLSSGITKIKGRVVEQKERIKAKEEVESANSLIAEL